MAQHPQNQVIGTRLQRKAVWLTGHGSDDIHSVSVNGTNPAGQPYTQIPDGAVVGWHEQDGIAYPLAADTAQAAVSSANLILVEDVLQFTIGDVVELPSSVAANATRFRAITAIDYDAGSITLGGAAFSLALGDIIEVDPTRSVDASVGAVTTANDVVLSDSSRFVVGDAVELGTVGTRNITAIDSGTDTITVDGATFSLADGDAVVSGKDGGYEITTETVDIDNYTYVAQNTTVPCRKHGRVRESNVIGLTAAAKTAMANLITFDSRLY